MSKHIALVRTSGRTEEIRLTKIWRGLQGLEFPSLALELAVLEPTSRRRLGAVADNFWEVLRYLAESFPRARLVDPSNTANIVSDDLTVVEKAAIARAARSARPRCIPATTIYVGELRLDDEARSAQILHEYYLGYAGKPRPWPTLSILLSDQGTCERG